MSHTRRTDTPPLTLLLPIPLRIRARLTTEWVGVGAVTATATPTAAVATPASKVPGFEAIFAAVSLLIVYAMVFRKKGKRSE